MEKRAGRPGSDALRDFHPHRRHQFLRAYQVQHSFEVVGQRCQAPRVGVAYKDAQERYADFHALRYTFATFMRKNGMPDNFVRKQMRHKTIRQTDGYTDETQLPIYDAIKGLPRLPGYTQIRAQISGPEGQSVAQTVASSEGNKSEKAPENVGVCRGLAHGRRNENGASEGIRTLDTHVGNVMLYQAELRSLPEDKRQIMRTGRICKPDFRPACPNPPTSCGPP